jgi:hypothetical protein
MGYNHSYAYGYQQSNATNLVMISNENHSQATTPQTNPMIISQATNEPSQWSCDSCDLAFDSEKAWKSHRKSHVKCSDCSFEGAPKVVKAHYQALHGKFAGSGFKTVTVAIPGCRVQKFKICVGNRPEDIQRWIAERRKKFPRTRRVENAADVLPSIQQKQQNLSGSSTPAAGNEPEKAGLSMLLAGYGSSDDDSDNDNDDGVQGKQPLDHVTTASQTTPILSVEQGDHSRAQAITSPEPERKPSTPPTRSCRFFFRNGSCRNGDACRFSHEIPPPANGNQSNKNANNQDSRKRHRGGHTSSDTLLRKLLENDMDRESTLTMQLLKYIVRNKYFMGNDDAKAKKAKI